MLPVILRAFEIVAVNLDTFTQTGELKRGFCFLSSKPALNLVLRNNQVLERKCARRSLLEKSAGLGLMPLFATHRREPVCRDLAEEVDLWMPFPEYVPDLL